MKDGFLKVAAMTPDVLVANPVFNGEKIREGMDLAAKEGARLLLLPELCLTAYTCSDLFM